MRPHQLTLRSPSSEEEATQSHEQSARIRCKVELIEPLGSETLVYARPLLSEISSLLVVRAESSVRVKRGEEVTLELALANAHLFTPDERGACIRW